MAGEMPLSAITVEPTDMAGGVVRERKRERERKRTNRRCHDLDFFYTRPIHQEEDRLQDPANRDKERVDYKFYSTVLY